MCGIILFTDHRVVDKITDSDCFSLFSFKDNKFCEFYLFALIHTKMKPLLWQTGKGISHKKAYR